MATENSTENGATSANSTDPAGLDFTLTGPIYRFTENASSYDVKQHLDMRLSQLEAMLSVLADVPPFIQHQDVRMGEYFTACETLARECKELSRVLDAHESDNGDTSTTATPEPQGLSCTSDSWIGRYRRAESALINIESLAIGALESIHASDLSDDYLGAGSHLVALIRMRAREGMGEIGDWTKEDAA